MRTERSLVPVGAGLASLVAVPFLLFVAAVGMSALREDFEGVRPLVAVLAVLVLALAAATVSATVRAVHVPRRALWVVAVGAALVAVYLFFAAAPGGPSSGDSWGELIGAVVALWLGLLAFRLLGDGPMWAFVGAAGVALVTGSALV